MSLLRSSSFPAWYQKEVSTIYETKFRFSEKMRPDDYAVWISDHMAWPVDRDLILTAPQLVQEWDDSGSGEKEVRDMLSTLTIERGRAVIMARSEELNSALSADHGDIKWQHEPWYGTGYLVEKFDKSLVKQVKFTSDSGVCMLTFPRQMARTTSRSCSSSALTSSYQATSMCTKKKLRR
jgi:insulysin